MININQLNGARRTAVWQFPVEERGKTHTRSARLSAVSPRLPSKQCQCFSWLNTDRSRPRRVKCRSFPFSTPLSSINAVMLWPVHVQKVPQTSKHLCPAKLQTRWDVCCACQSVCPFIPSDSGMARAADPHKSLQPKTTWLCASQGSPSSPHGAWQTRARHNFNELLRRNGLGASAKLCPVHISRVMPWAHRQNYVLWTSAE